MATSIRSARIKPIPSEASSRAIVARFLKGVVGVQLDKVGQQESSHRQDLFRLASGDHGAGHHRRNEGKQPARLLA